MKLPEIHGYAGPQPHHNRVVTERRQRRSRAFKRLDLVGGIQNALGKQKPCCEFMIRTRRAHGHGDRANNPFTAVIHAQANFEGFFYSHYIGLSPPYPPVYANYRDFSTVLISHV